MDWEDEFRPQKFRDVCGQPQAVLQISRQITRGLRPRSLFLTGAVGSGKTTIIRIFAKALNCNAVESDGSPCGQCEYCLDLSRSLLEWDTTGRGGEVSTVLSLIEQNRFAVERGKYRVLFFDECHALKAEAQDALLKSIEERLEGVLFCFATTERNGIRAALLSRLCEVPIYPINPRDAYNHLEWIARLKGLDFEPSALHLLVASKPPYLRDLVIGLQELAEIGKRLTVDLVKENLGLQICDHLAAYMRSLALGNRAEQVRVMQAWPGEVVDKCRWIERFLSSAYYNDVLGVEYVTDPLVHSLADARRDFVQGLQNRLRLDRSGLERFAQEWLAFWSTNTTGNESSAHTVLALFEAMIGNEIQRIASHSPNDKSAEKPSEQLFPSGSESSECLDRISTQFLTTGEVREIVNRASFFAQEYGEYFNSSISIITKGQTSIENQAHDTTSKFIRDLDKLLGCGQGCFGAIGVLEREQGVIVARVLANVRRERRDELLNLCAAVSRPGTQIADMRYSRGDTDSDFQWTEIRDMCASFDGYGFGGEEARKLLKLPSNRRRVAGPLACQRVLFSSRLSARAIADASFPMVQPLSAFDAAAANWIDNGWEVKEAPSRKREIAVRRRRLDALLFEWRSDAERLEFERMAVLASWAKIVPEQRARTWRGWW